MNNDLKTWAKDTAERTVFTFAQSFLGLLAVSASGAIDNVTMNTIEAALVSSVVAALAVLKGALAARLNGISPASFLPHADK